MNLSGTNRFFSKLPYTRKSWAYVLFTIYSCMLLTYFQVFPALTSTTVDTQFFSGQRLNDTTTTTIPSSLCFLIVNFGKKILPHIKIESFCSKICRYYIDNVFPLFGFY